MVVTLGVTEPLRHPGDEMEPGGVRKDYEWYGHVALGHPVVFEALF